MNLYKRYMQLWRKGESCAGFSQRLPDYAIRFWIKSFEEAIARCSVGKFLDIGAGNGRLSQLLISEYNPAGTAIEVQIDHTIWNKILKKHTGLKLKQGLLQSLVNQLKDGKFNLAILVEVFEHIPPKDILTFLSNLNSVLTNDGMIFLTTPNRIAQGPAEQSKAWHEKQPYGHYKHYTYTELKDILTEAGFAIEWSAYECHWIKTTFYNKLFYPISRLDARLMNSNKLPVTLRTIYKYTTIPAILGIRSISWTIAQFVYFIEKYFGSQNTSATIMLLAKKQHNCS
jgi:2-polyprenyl-3-methyl-5-hydroxy-6-metoxy-1,4-benzoquinol methylase